MRIRIRAATPRGTAIGVLAIALVSSALLVHAQALPAPVATVPAGPASPPAAAPDPVPPQAAALGSLECEVWARELGFARSVAGHDAEAFAGHLHPRAAFGSGQPVPIRGRAAIVKRWARLIAGEGVRLHWYPTRVTVAGNGDLAWSTGPSLFEDLATDAENRYLIGVFHSVWQRDAAGTWHVVFDDGLEPKPATPAQVEAFHAGRTTACPPG